MTLLDSVYRKYCFLTGGQCPHHPVAITPNSFFVAEPYDDERELRESAIKKAFEGYTIIIADENALNIAITCKICQQIQSAQFGIVDITSLNPNVLIELGILYGLTKPVIILVKESEQVEIVVPSNIVGIEQVRYANFDELRIKLTAILKELLKLWADREERILDILPAIRRHLQSLEIAIATKKILNTQFEMKIIDFKIIGEQAFVILDKGEREGITRDMMFKVFRCDQQVGEDYLEEDIGIIIITHPQRQLSQALPYQYDPHNDFWNNAINRTSHPRNVVKPYLLDAFENKSVEELLEQKIVLRNAFDNILAGMVRLNV